MYARFNHEQRFSFMVALGSLATTCLGGERENHVFPCTLDHMYMYDMI